MDLEDIVEKSTEMDALTRTVVSHVKKLSEVNPFFTEEMRLAMINAPGPGTVADLVAKGAVRDGHCVSSPRGRSDVEGPTVAPADRSGPSKCFDRSFQEN